MLYLCPHIYLYGMANTLRVQRTCMYIQWINSVNCTVYTNLDIYPFLGAIHKRRPQKGVKQKRASIVGSKFNKHSILLSLNNENPKTVKLNVPSSAKN